MFQFIPRRESIHPHQVTNFVTIFDKINMYAFLTDAHLHKRCLAAHFGFLMLCANLQLSPSIDNAHQYTPAL